MDESTHKKNFKPIVLRDLFMDKSPSLARWIPGFIFRLLSRILRIDFMNSILYNHGYKKNVGFAKASIEVFNVSLEVVGKDRLPAEGRYIFVANHPPGGFDGMMIISKLCDKYQELKVMVNDLLMNVKNMDGIFVPINKHFVITFGKPIPFETFDSRFTPKQWAAHVKEHTYAIADHPEATFNYTEAQNNHP